MKNYSSNTGVDPKTGTVVDKHFDPLEKAINNGDPVVVRVNGQDMDGNWVIADPFNDPNHPIITLSDPDYGNRIYAYDWGVFLPGGLSDPYSTPSPYDIDSSDLYNLDLNPDQYGFSSYMISLGKISPVPEPASITLLLTGLLALARRERKLEP